MQSRFRWILALLAAGSLTVARGGVGPASNVTGSFERTLKVSGPVEIVVTGDSSDFKVRAGAASEVRILGRVHAEKKWQTAEAAEKALREIEAHPPIQQEGNVIRIGWTGDRKSSAQVSVDYELVVPLETRWRSVADSGDLWISGIRGPVDIKTGFGDIRLESVKGAVRARTGSGDVLLQDAGSEQIEIETGSGDVHIQLPPGVGCDLTAQTTSGDISAPEGFAVEARMPHSEVHVKVRSGGFPVNIRTGSGDIRID